MNASSEAEQLRPPGIGEIFDRAVTVPAKNAAVFAIAIDDRDAGDYFDTRVRDEGDDV